MPKAFFLPVNNTGATIMEFSMDWHLTVDKPVIIDTALIPLDWQQPTADHFGVKVSEYFNTPKKVTFAVDTIGVTSHPDYKGVLVPCFFLRVVQNTFDAPQAPAVPAES